MLYYILFIFLIIWPNISEARPVSYPGGTTLMFMNSGDVNSLHLHYSPSAKYSIGYKAEYWRDGEYTIQALQLNNLLKRWNNRGSQANFYLKSGVGIGHSDKGSFDNETDFAGYTGIAADWEDRRYFISYENRYTEAGDIDNFYMHSARVGITPYIGDYGDLHTWLMLEAEHQPEAKDKYKIMPMVRFFKDVHLAEFGFSNQGDVMLNYIIRF